MPDDDEPNLSDQELIAQRLLWFETYSQGRNVFAPEGPHLHTSPNCRHYTLDSGGETSDRLPTIGRA